MENKKEIDFENMIGFDFDSDPSFMESDFDWI